LGKGAPVHKTRMAPSGFKRTNILHNIDSNPSHFSSIRRKECKNCESDKPCCEADCAMYQKSKQRNDVEACDNCPIYKISCNGPGQRARKKKRNDEVDKHILDSCPF